MRNQWLSGVLSAGAILLFCDVGLAHGGQYRGPADTVPPDHGGGRSSGPAGPTTGGPAGPTAPRPSGPATGGGSGPSSGGGSGPGGRGPTAGGRSGGSAIDVDLTTWDFWWEFNKDPYLSLKDAVRRSAPKTGSDDYWLGPGRRNEAIDSVKPTRDVILGDVLPALKRAIDSTEQHDIVSSCMIAMAKIGTDHPDFRLVDVFAPRLQRGNQEVRETAALAIGIAAINGTDEVQLLTDLALDDEAGRKASGGAVGDRTRAFAMYGLGLLAHEHTNAAVKSAAFTALDRVLGDDSIRSRDLKVAAIQSIGILDIGRGTVDDDALMDAALKSLETFYCRDLGSGDLLVQSHCATAVAKLIGRDHARSEHYRALFAADLQGKSRRSSNDLSRSCALALGRLCRANDEDVSPDAQYSDVLVDAYQNHKDHQTRNFAVLALGQIGGGKNRAYLVRSLRNAKGLDKPWCALALGVYSHALYEAQEKVDQTFEQDRQIGDVLFEQFQAAHDPSFVSACAIALGLNRCTEAAAAMQQRLTGDEQKQDQAGYLCIGLALMQDRGSIAVIQDVLARASHRTDLLKQAAIALGKLGDKYCADYLRDRMKENGTNLATLSALASALGYIGDQRSIAPLKGMLFDKSLGDLARAFAAVALGGIADRAALPWNSKIGVDTNYRANVETLTNQQSGILDIL